MLRFTKIRILAPVGLGALLVAMALLFMIKERMTQRSTYPLLSCSDIERC